MKLIRAVLKLPKIMGVIILLCFFGSFLNSCITFTPPQKTQSHRDSAYMTYLHTSQVLPINQVEHPDEYGNSKTTNVEYQHVLMSNRVKAVAADERNVWIGTDKGVSSLNRLTGKWTHYTMSDVLASDSVNDILINADLVWFATERGASQLNLGMWRNFDARDGLVGDNVTCIALDGDYAWFGTDGGLNRYDKRIDNWAALVRKTFGSLRTVFYRFDSMMAKGIRVVLRRPAVLPEFMKSSRSAEILI